MWVTNIVKSQRYLRVLEAMFGLIDCIKLSWILSIFWLTKQGPLLLIHGCRHLNYYPADELVMAICEPSWICSLFWLLKIFFFQIRLLTLTTWVLPPTLQFWGKFVDEIIIAIRYNSNTYTFDLFGTMFHNWKFITGTFSEFLSKVDPLTVFKQHSSISNCLTP